MRLHRPVPHHHQPHLAHLKGYDDGGIVDPGAFLSTTDTGGSYSNPNAPVDTSKNMPAAQGASATSSGNTAGVPAPITDKVGADNSKDQSALVQHAQQVYSSTQSALEKAYNMHLQAYGNARGAPKPTHLGVPVGHPTPPKPNQDTG